MNRRYPELDILKGIATILMIYVHHKYFSFLKNPSTNNITNTDLLFSRISHTIFLLLLGINYYISYKNKSFKLFKQKIMKRILTYTVVSLFVTISSYVIFPNKFIIFGIFHFISFALGLMLFCVDSKQNIIYSIAATLVLAAVFKRTQPINKNIVIKYLYRIIGLDLKFEAIDHFPIIPYLLYPLLGLFIGHLNYNRHNLKINNTNIFYRIISEIGNKSFFIYIIHYIILIVTVLIN